jgi:hypothetical protein
MLPQQATGLLADKQLCLVPWHHRAVAVLLVADSMLSQEMQCVGRAHGISNGCWCLAGGWTQAVAAAAAAAAMLLLQTYSVMAISSLSNSLLFVAVRDRYQRR